MNVVPAYGRDYTSAKAVKADWDANKDFLIADMSSPYDGKYINLADAKNGGIKVVTIRYSKNRKVTVVKVA